MQGENRDQEALKEFVSLRNRITQNMQKQYYYQWLPVKMAESLVKTGKLELAMRYLDVVTSDWDEKPYKAAKELKKTINI